MTDRVDWTGLRDRVRNVKPASVRVYLMAAGWTRAESYSRGYLWQYTAGDGAYEVYQPGDPDVRDYVSRVTDLVDVITVVENRTPAEVLDDLSEIGHDIQYFKLRPDTPSGTIPLWNLAEALGGIRRLNVSAAYAELVSAEALVQPRNKPNQVSSLARSALVGQTRPSSYVISVKTGAPEGVGPSPGTEQSDIPRRVAQRMSDAITLAHELVAQNLPFEYAVTSRLSANFLEALAMIGGKGESRMRFSIATGWPPPVGPWAERSVVQFDLTHLDGLRESASRIREIAKARTVTVEGQVVFAPEGGTVTGVVKIQGNARGGGDRRRKDYLVELSSDLYAHAVEANHRDTRVRVKGELIHEDATLRIVGVKEFTLTEA